MTSLAQAQKDLGQLFITGFSGLELSDPTAAWIHDAGIGGVILFSANYESPGQLAELTNQIQGCRGDLPLWIGVDQEGGRVQRFKKPFTKLPEAQLIGASQSPKLAFEIAEMMAKELAAVGINLNFAPVADIATNAKNPVIGNRSYGATEELVTKMATATVRGHLLHGVQPCVKHFPGHGDTSTDSHFALPKVDTDLATLRARELRPFAKCFKSGCSFVMTAHILMTKLDPRLPATLSAKILQEYLREELRYDGLIVSDDMEMKAIADHFGAEEAPRLAIEAGCDLVSYRTENAARTAYVALQKALVDGTLSHARVTDSAQRVRSIKRDVLTPYHPIAVADLPQKIGLPESLALVKKLEELAHRK